MFCKIKEPRRGCFKTAATVFLAKPGKIEAQNYRLLKKLTSTKCVEREKPYSKTSDGECKSPFWTST